MAGKNRIEIRESKDKQKFISVKSANNKPIVTSETYKSNQAVNAAVKNLKKIIKNSEVIDRTKKKQ